jgi:hypothetical protein
LRVVTTRILVVVRRPMSVTRPVEWMPRAASSFLISVPDSSLPMTPIRSTAAPSSRRLLATLAAPPSR